MPPLTAFLPLIGQGVNAAAQLLTNRSNKKTALEIYDKQRTDALADWNRQNQYNSPAAQMQRFKDAGLSPHLIYGQTNTAPPVRSNTLETPRAQAPQMDTQAMDPLMPQYGLMMDTQWQNLRNLKAQEDAIIAETLKKVSDGKIAGVNLSLLRETYDNLIKQSNSRTKILGEQEQISQQQRFQAQNKTSLFAAERNKLNAETARILSQTKLSNEQKAQVEQVVKNLKVTEKILGSQEAIQKYEAETMQKLKALSLGGGTLIQIMKMIFGK